MSHRLFVKIHGVRSVYPWSDLPQDTLICDVGGSNGHTMLELAQNFPQLKIIVQDLATVQPLWNEARHSFCAS